jgi:hypothetical protein
VPISFPPHSLSPSNLAALRAAENVGAPFLAFKDGDGELRLEPLVDIVEVGAIISVGAAALPIFFGAYLRRVLREAAGEREILSIVSFVGVALTGFAFAIDATIGFALADRADNISPAAVQALQALWDNDFLPLVLGVELFLFARGSAV